jgi:hypothetical protein
MRRSFLQNTSRDYGVIRRGLCRIIPPMSATINRCERVCLNFRSVAELTDIVATL